MNHRRTKQILPVLAGLAVIAIVGILAVIAGAYYFLRPSLPSAEAMRDIELQTPLRVYTRDGRLMAQIGQKRRTPVVYEEIPDIVIKAFLAAEDDRFFEHPGFDYQGIARAAFNLMLTGSRSQGGSTITQQLAREYFLTRDRSFVRKAREIILALQIEQKFTKEEILALYLNKIFLGQRAYGVGAAAEVYFGKSLQELDIAEAAVIAGLPKAPSTLNPVSNIERATERRAYVLRRMLELTFIDRQQYDTAISSVVESKLYGPRVELGAPYVTEMVRAEMIRRYGLDAYTAGYNVVTTIDSRLQASATKSLRAALLEYDRRHGYRGPVAKDVLANLERDISNGDDVETEGPATDETGSVAASALANLLSTYPSYDDLHIAVVLATNEDDSAEIYIRDVGRTNVAWETLRWRPYIDDNNVGAAPKTVGDLLAVGDLVYLLNTENKGWQLAQMPQVQGAFVALDPRDGATVALTGGFDYFASKFNRAVQTKRQPGSSFKPFIYSAALDNGFTTATLVNDAPVVFDDDQLETAWRPENYSRKFHGPTRLREALIKSLNLVSVRILRGTGIGPALQHIQPFGLPPSALPRDLSLALGSGGASPWDLAAGYSVFASGGYRINHYLIDRVEDSSNVTLFRATPTYVCNACQTIWVDERNPDAIPINNQPLLDSPDEEADSTDVLPATTVDDEVPLYRDVDEMMRHGLEWRPTAQETPIFLGPTNNQAPRVITAENAYLIYDMMRDVIQRGTGRRARELGRPDLAGKTGTSNDRRDAWFSGFNGDLVATAWVGFDQDRSLGAGEEGSRTALPIWKYFMQDALAEAPNGLIPQPSGIITVRIVPESGLVAPAGYQGAIFELFREGHIPDLHTEDAGQFMSPRNVDNPEDDDETLF
jgi:penicillin-binding protein 1A